MGAAGEAGRSRTGRHKRGRSIIKPAYTMEKLKERKAWNKLSKR